MHLETPPLIARSTLQACLGKVGGGGGSQGKKNKFCHSQGTQELGGYRQSLGSHGRWGVVNGLGRPIGNQARRAQRGCQLPKLCLNMSILEPETRAYFERLFLDFWFCCCHGSFTRSYFWSASWCLWLLLGNRTPNKTRVVFSWTLFVPSDMAVNLDLGSPQTHTRARG